MKEANDKLTLTFDQARSISQAIRLLEKIKEISG